MTEINVATGNVVQAPHAIEVPPNFVDHEPNLDMGQKAVAIHLISPAEMANCSFWVGLFHKGRLSPFELLDKGSVQELFQHAASQGIKESSPIMLSDSQVHPARYLYLVPEPEESFHKNENLIQDLIKTVCAWSPSKAGIFLTPKILKYDKLHEILFALMSELIRTSKVTDFYLTPGPYGLNQVLNTALAIKNGLQDEALQVYVFH